MPVRLKRRLLTVEEYHRMGEVGILQEKGLELIKGEIIEMSPIGSKHAALVEKLKILKTIKMRRNHENTLFKIYKKRIEITQFFYLF